jgi:hypothetical protein
LDAATVDTGATVGAGATIGRDSSPVTDQRTATSPIRAATINRMLRTTSPRDLEPGTATSHRPHWGANDTRDLLILAQVGDPVQVPC